jgi:hypothetical protein
MKPTNVKPSREEVWSDKFQQVKEFYEEHGHLTLPRKEPKKIVKLSQWLAHQRRQATSKCLRKDQLDQLESIHFNTVPIHREDYANAWEDQFERLQRCVIGSEGVRINGDRPLTRWWGYQKTLYRQGLLDQTRQMKLEQFGLSNAKYRKRKKIKNTTRLDVQWLAQYEKLKAYHRTKGDCNVPICWEGDHSLAVWVGNQRQNHKLRVLAGGEMDPDRIQKLEQLGFQWSVRSVRSRLLIVKDQTENDAACHTEIQDASYLPPSSSNNIQDTSIQSIQDGERCVDTAQSQQYDSLASSQPPSPSLRISTISQAEHLEASNTNTSN